MQSVQKEEMLPPVDVSEITLETLTLNVNLSALLTQSALETKPVSTISVRTHVLVSVGFMHHAELGTIFPSVLVILDIQGMHLLPAHVLRHVRFLVDLVFASSLYYFSCTCA